MTGGAPRVISFTPQSAHASSHLTGGRIDQIEIELNGAQGKDATFGAASDRTFSAAHMRLFLERENENVSPVALTVDNAKIGHGFAPVFGGDVERVSLEGQLLQTGAFDTFERGEESLADAAAAWRKAHGRFTVDTLSFRWGALDTTLNGVLGLDERLDPTGTLTGVIDPAALVGSLLGGTFEAPQSGPLTLSLTFKNGDIEAKAALASAGSLR
jgi:hypothetical protein